MLMTVRSIAECLGPDLTMLYITSFILAKLLKLSESQFLYQ